MKRSIVIFADIFLGFIMRTYHKMEKLTEKEVKAQKAYIGKINVAVSSRKTKRPLVVGFVGLIGSGKTTLAKELASLIGATVISGDDIRVLLRKEKEKYDKARTIAENATMEIFNNGGNVIVDSDFIDQKKRVSLKEKAKKVGAKIIFIRTYSDLDVIIGRITNADHENIEEDFFGGASSVWQGANKGNVVKLREMYRRIPHHYRWMNQSGGKWILKKMLFNVFAEIDTTKENKWKQEVKMIAGQIRSCY